MIFWMNLKRNIREVTIVDDSQGDESAFNNILSTDIASGTMANIFRIQGVANLSEYIDNGLILDVHVIVCKITGSKRRVLFQQFQHICISALYGR